MRKLNFVFWNIHQRHDADRLLSWLLDENTLIKSICPTFTCDDIFAAKNEGKSLEDVIEQLNCSEACKLQQPDVLLFAEAPSKDEDYEVLKLGLEENDYIEVCTFKYRGSQRLAVFRRKSARVSMDKDVNIIQNHENLAQNGWRYRLLRLNVLGQYHIYLVHLLSKSTVDHYSQVAAAIEVAEIIQKDRDSLDSGEPGENSSAHKYIIVGDFNMNPWEPGMLLANGFCSTYTRFRESDLSNVESNDLGQMTTELKSGQGYPPHYNPVWGLMGEANRNRDNQPLGTYNLRRKLDKGSFKMTGGSLTHYQLEWNMIDQALVSPALNEHFDDNYFSILNYDKKELQCPSDHFPIYFTINDPDNDA